MEAHLSKREFCRLAGISDRTATRWIRAGKLPVVRLSERVVRIPRNAAERILTQGFPGDGGLGNQQLTVVEAD